MGAVNPADHMGLVYTIAQKYARRSKVELDDLVQVGALGVMRAAEKFDPKRGVKFSTYAANWIHANCCVLVSESASGAVYLPYRQVRNGRKHMMMSLDKTHGEGEETWTEYDRIAAETPDPLDAIETRQRARAVHRAISSLRLTKAEEVVINGYLRGQTLQETGEQIGVCRERTRQILAQIFRALKPRLERALA
jgi:RNA polymerase sigma factor (sigma-70 family)